MLTFFEETTSPVMGNGPTNGETNPDEEYYQTNRTKRNGNGLIFYAGTDKARV